VACSDFFSREAQLAQPAPDRLTADTHAGAGVQIVGQLAAKRIGLLRHQLRQHLLLLLIVELRRVSAGVRTRSDQTFLTITLPDASRRCGRAGHDPGDIIAFQPALKELDDPPPHRQGECFHAGPLLVRNRPKHT
jgi:hypothetical protein